MTGDVNRLRVLITVMTYPHPKESHDEVVCTAGVTEAGEWVRLFPVDYRYLPKQKQFHKYQWIELDVLPRGYKTDGRKESREPKLDSIQLRGEPLPPANKWQARREIIDRLPHRTVRQLIQLHQEERVSLGVARPTRARSRSAAEVKGPSDGGGNDLRGYLVRTTVAFAARGQANSTLSRRVN
jgi:hypothetical protein